MFEKLDDSNFTLFAAKSYDNPNCVDTQEFEDDLNRIKYLKKLFKKYHDKNELKTRLILNHLIVLYNVFGPPEACTRMLVWKLDEYTEYLKPFLILLNYWPDRITGLGTKGLTIRDSDIRLDQGIVNQLREEFGDIKN